MKRLLLFGLCLVLVSSCCLRTDSQGVTTKSFRNCTIAAQEMVCNPPDSVKAVVQVAAPIVASLVNFLIPGTQEYINAQTALNVINSVQQIGCTSLTALNQLIAFMQSSTFKTAAQSGKYAARPVSVNVQPLVDWSHTAKQEKIMSDYHVLDQAVDGKTINVVFHFPVPATNNAAGVSYRVALVNFLGGADNINSAVADSTEIVALKAGELYELTHNLRWSRMGLTPAQKLSEIVAAYNTANATMVTYFADVLQYYGKTGDV